MSRRAERYPRGWRNRFRSGHIGRGRGIDRYSSHRASPVAYDRWSSYPIASRPGAQDSVSAQINNSIVHNSAPGATSTAPPALVQGSATQRDAFSQPANSAATGPVKEGSNVGLNQPETVKSRQAIPKKFAITEIPASRGLCPPGLYTETDQTGWRDLYHAIVAIEAFQGFSAEEIHLKDLVVEGVLDADTLKSCKPLNSPTHSIQFKSQPSTAPLSIAMTGRAVQSHKSQTETFECFQGSVASQSVTRVTTTSPANGKLWCVVTQEKSTCGATTTVLGFYDDEGMAHGCACQHVIEHHLDLFKAHGICRQMDNSPSLPGLSYKIEDERTLFKATGAQGQWLRTVAIYGGHLKRA